MNTLTAVILAGLALMTGLASGIEGQHSAPAADQHHATGPRDVWPDQHHSTGPRDVWPDQA